MANPLPSPRGKPWYDVRYAGRQVPLPLNPPLCMQLSWSSLAAQEQHSPATACRQRIKDSVFEVRPTYRVTQKQLME
jgi:hypothetical protein